MVQSLNPPYFLRGQLPKSQFSSIFHQILISAIFPQSHLFFLLCADPTIFVNTSFKKTSFLHQIVLVVNLHRDFFFLGDDLCSLGLMGIQICDLYSPISNSVFWAYFGDFFLVWWLKGLMMIQIFQRLENCLIRCL